MRTAASVPALFTVLLFATVGCDPAIETCDSDTCEQTVADDEPEPTSDPEPDPIDAPAAKTNKVDLLFIVDNSGTMAGEQERIGRAMAGLQRSLSDRQLDVHVMFTTVDFGNQACAEHAPPDYVAARGRPTGSACTDRIDDFTGLDDGFGDATAACDSVCPTAAAPIGADFVAFGPQGSNAPNVVEQDIDGDGEPDSAAAMTMACLAPQGVNGCGYEAPLENILQALNSEAPWNSGPSLPFLRDDAVLAIGLITDEADCSVSDFSLMDDETYMEIDPETGMPRASSALCWNAGVTCSGPDGQGGYEDCVASDSGPLHPLVRYQRHLIEELRGRRDKEVVMLGLVGVPSEGVDALEFRDWADRDLLPSDRDAGRTVQTEQFTYGIGPGCTSVGADGTTSHAVPPPRIIEVCESLDVGDGPGDARCCLQSICDDDYGPAMECLVGLIDNVTQ